MVMPAVPPSPLPERPGEAEVSDPATWPTLNECQQEIVDYLATCDERRTAPQIMEGMGNGTSERKLKSEPVTLTEWRVIENDRKASPCGYRLRPEAEWRARPRTGAEDAS